MRNYRRYWLAKMQLQFQQTPGNWIDSSLDWQIGRTQSELEDNIAADQAALDPNFFRFNPITRLGVYYFLLDSDLLIQCAFRFLQGFQQPPPGIFQPPPSPRSTWSHGH